MENKDQTVEDKKEKMAGKGDRRGREANSKNIYLTEMKER